MPTYVYKFLDTGETIEVQQAFTDETLTEAVHPRDRRDDAGQEGLHSPSASRSRATASTRPTAAALEEPAPRSQSESSSAERRRAPTSTSTSASGPTRIAVESDSPRRAPKRPRRARRRRPTPKSTAGRRRRSSATHAEQRLSDAHPDQRRRRRARCRGRDHRRVGLLRYLDDPVEITVTTPYGEAAAPIAVGTIAGRRVAFLAPPRPPPRLRGAPGAVPGQRLGDGVRSACVR